MRLINVFNITGKHYISSTRKKIQEKEDTKSLIKYAFSRFNPRFIIHLNCADLVFKIWKQKWFTYLILPKKKFKKSIFFERKKKIKSHQTKQFLRGKAGYKNIFKVEHFKWILFIRKEKPNSNNSANFHL